MAKYLFHKDVFMPDVVKKAAEATMKTMGHVYPSKHIFKQVRKYANPVKGNMHNYDVKKAMQKANSLRTNQVEPFEVEVKNLPGTQFYFISKFVSRQSYDDKDDISIPIATLDPTDISKSKVAIAKTAWLNRKYDNHGTLDRAKYDIKLGGKQ